LNNALAASQQLVKETQTAVSSRAFEIEGLKAQNSDLQKVIQKKKEEVFALTDVAIQWKNKYFDIKNAKQVVVNEAGTQPASLSSECEDCIARTRIKVEFDQTKDDLRIFGYTITSPAQAQINLEWLKPLQLQLVLTKSDDGSFKVYLDEKDKAESQLIVPKELTLKIDPSVLQRKWYEKIALGVDVGASQLGVNGSFRAMYGIKPNFYLGPSVSISALFTGQVAPFYGVSLLWSPFLRN
jgi:hypothetical protein